MKLFKDYLLECDRNKAIQFAADKHEKKYRKNAREGYKYLFELLLKKTNRKSNFKIEVHYVKDNKPKIDDFEPYYHVHGISIKDSEPWAIEFTSWSVWLGSELTWDKGTDKIVKERGVEFVIGECLWEMTFMGWRESQIQYKIRRMNKAIEDIKSEKVKGKEYKNVKEMMESLIDDKELAKKLKG